MKNNEVSILVTGDFAPINRVSDLVKEDRLAEIYNDFYPLLENSDLNITNLECPLVDSESPISKVGPTLRANRDNINAIVYGKFHLLTLANNHIFDHGIKGLKSTIETCKENGIDYVGASNLPEEVRKVYYVTIKGVKIGILNIAENEYANAVDNTKPGANPLDIINNYYQITEARSNVDFLIMIIHGGHEYYKLPSPNMTKTYRFFIDLGVDVVVGHHPHCYSGYERYGSGYIFYSLGNFLFDSNKPGRRNNNPWNYGYALKLNLGTTKEIKFDIIPFLQNDSSPGIQLLTEGQKKEFENNIQNLNSILRCEKTLEESWNKRVKERSYSYLKKLVPFKNRILKHVYFKLIKLHEKYLLLTLNHLRCESHREILIKILEAKLKKGKSN